ncbi:MAG: hypothetical protein COB26_05230 [Piscirickettsiaceae bacterium]|nr:MAG: hypothetical protein COB89_01450 [Piscirickettsiaceae bacterium]PCI70046.1 MAG: hypothetical protein COB26_05230 [Piscirickettsiaceae bacterium]
MHKAITLIILAFLALVFGHASATDDGIYIKQAELTQNEQSTLFNARIDYYLNDDIVEALDSGITLTFNVSLVIFERRPWLWNKRQATLIFPFRLKYNTLSQTYQVTNVTNNRKQVFSGLTPALHALGTIADVSIYNIPTELTSNHSATLDVSLNIEALPLPMRPLAYIKPNWHVRSDTFQWLLNQ